MSFRTSLGWEPRFNQPRNKSDWGRSTMALALEIEHGDGGSAQAAIDRNACPMAIDFAYLKKFTLGNRDLEREVLYLFAQHSPGYLANLRQAGSAKAWRDAAHTLKGSARAVGAWRVAKMAEAAERFSFETEKDRCGFACDSCAEAIDEAIAYIVQVFPET
jgi:HPt (histidine-containing phosphotransfer) domain-containing protein